MGGGGEIGGMQALQLHLQVIQNNAREWSCNVGPRPPFLPDFHLADD